MKTLREITDHVASGFANKAGLQNSFFVNEIPADLGLSQDPQMYASVMSGLLSTLVYYSPNSCIRVTAKAFDHVIMVKVKDSNTSDIYGIEQAVQKFRPLAEMMRGSVHVTHQRKKLTTITFGFPVYN
jgi:hypothetical protein